MIIECSFVLYLKNFIMKNEYFNQYFKGYFEPSFWWHLDIKKNKGKMCYNKGYGKNKTGLKGL